VEIVKNSRARIATIYDDFVIRNLTHGVEGSFLRRSVEDSELLASIFMGIKDNNIIKIVFAIISPKGDDVVVYSNGSMVVSGRKVGTVDLSPDRSGEIGLNGGHLGEERSHTVLHCDEKNAK